MTFYISPAVKIIERDLTLDTTEISDNVGAIAGTFQWGPVGVPTLLTGGEPELASRFAAPNNDTYLSFLVAADFLSYSNKMLINRAVGPLAKNAVTTGQTAVLVKNEEALEDANLAAIDFLAKYPGAPGNGLTIDIADSAKFATWEFRTAFQFAPGAGEFAIAVVDGSGFWTGTGSNKQTEKLTVTGTVSAAGNLTVFGETVAVLLNDTAATVATKIAAVLDASDDWDTVSASQGTVSYTSLTPGLKAAQAAPTAALGITFGVSVTSTGRLGTILERYELMEDKPSAKFPDGTSKYFFSAIRDGSQYVTVGDKTVALSARSVILAGGIDDNVGVNLTAAFQDFGNAEAIDVNYIISGAVDSAVQSAVYDIGDLRRDCFTFHSPQLSDVYNNKGDEVRDIKEWRTVRTNKESSYAINDSNWALVYDKYNDVNRWIPTCGGTAGLKARTDRDQDPWISPAGYENGRYKNYIKLAWSPTEAQRDEIYKIGVNPVVSFPGQGILLFGDKTSLQRPSSFGEIGVRSAFIVAEKSIANMSKYFLFKVNDEYTRAQFLNAVRPFLRNMKARRAWEDFKVVADESNNGGAIRQSKKMVGTIWLKPTHSINYVVLEFNAVRSDVSFTEVESQLTTIGA